MSAETVSANDIAGAIMEMFNTLLLLDGLPDTPFPENVADAVKRFDRPELRARLVELLYERAPITPIVTPQSALHDTDYAETADEDMQPPITRIMKGHEE